MYRDAFAQFINLRKGGFGRTFPPLPDIDSATGLREAGLGQIISLKGQTHEGGGNVFQVVKAGTAVTKNRVVAWEGLTTCTVSDAGAAIGSGVIPIDSVAGFAANAAAGGFALIATTADNWAWYPILASTALSITVARTRVDLAPGDVSAGLKIDDDKTLVALAHTNTFYVLRPYHIVPMGTSGAFGQVGICPTSITLNQFGLVQKQGIGLIQATGALAAADLSGNLAADGQAATAETGVTAAGVAVTVLVLTSGAGVAPVHMSFPLN